MMKKVAIVTTKLNLGGCEKALISMLKEIPENKYDITLILKENGGELIKQVPEWINIKVIEEASMNTKEIVKKYIREKRYLKLITASYYLILMRLSKSKNRQLKYHSKALLDFEDEFDLAISYFMPPSFPDWYVSNHIKSKKKVIWIHSDISRIKDIQNKMHEKLYCQYDKIMCVCNDVADNFKRIFPSCKNKVSVFYNIIRESEIRSKAKNKYGLNKKNNECNILTVGRLSKEKGQDLIPNIVLRLKSEGLNFKWYCIGDGVLYDELEEKINRYKIKDSFILLGKKDNPYPYMRDCDIYVQPSKYEGYCTTVEEARCFKKPIIMTNCTGASEQVINCKTGYIVNYDENELYEKIKMLVLDKCERYRFTANSKNIIIDTSSEINKIDLIIEGKI